MAENVKIITGENFEQEVLKCELPVVLDFWASWCGPCKMFAPTFEEAANELAGKAVFGKINVDEQKELATKYKIMSIPTIITFKNGEMADKKVGALSVAGLKELI